MRPCTRKASEGTLLKRRQKADAWEKGYRMRKRLAAENVKKNPKEQPLERCSGCLAKVRPVTVVIGRRRRERVCPRCGLVL